MLRNKDAGATNSTPWLQIALAVAAGVSFWFFRDSMSEHQLEQLASELGLQRAWARVGGSMSAGAGLGMASLLLRGWQRGLPHFAPFLLALPALGWVAARGSASMLVGICCLFAGTLAMTPRNVPGLMRRCLGLAAGLVVALGIAGA